jgi:hypothetical protein
MVVVSWEPSEAAKRFGGDGEMESDYLTRSFAELAADSMGSVQAGRNGLALRW